MASPLKPLGAFENYPTPVRQSIGDGPQLSLRYVNIIRDLALIYQWLHNGQFSTNLRLPEKEKRLIRHFRQSLESAGRQSFLVESDSSAICLFDIALINLHELYYRLPTSSGDCILAYFLTVSSSQECWFEKALSLQLDYIFSFPEHRRIWVCIPDNQPASRELFLNNGFLFKAEYTSLQQRYGIFYMKRSDYINWMVTSS